MKRAATVLMALVVGSLLLAAGCSSTQFVSSWKDPSLQKGTVKKVFVVGSSRDLSVRHTFEDSFVKKLGAAKVEATASYQWYPDLDPKKIDKEAAAAKLRSEGYTHVIVSRLVDLKTEETYVPPTVMVGTMGPAYPGYYGGWYPYYSTTYMATPGYVSSQAIYSVETNLYELGKEGVAWSGLTKTTVSDYDQEHLKGLVEAIVYEMKAMKVI